MRKTLLSLAPVVSIALAGETQVYEQAENYVSGEFVADQRCYDHLFQLDGSYHSKSVTPHCEPYVNEETSEQMYKVQLQYLLPYTQDSDCTDESIVVGGQYLSQYETHEANTFYYDSHENAINLYFRHSDLDHAHGDPYYNCQQYTNEESFIWACPISLYIYHQGAVQFVYNFEFKVFINRILTDKIELFIQPNVVIGDCCINELNVESELFFCSDSSCTHHLAEPFYVMRQQVFYVEHKITSETFQHYYLDLIDCKLHGLIPDIISVDESKPGCVIIGMASQVAFQNMSLTVISQIREQEVGSYRRMLKGRNAQIKNSDDYKVKGSSLVSVKDGDSTQVKEEKEQLQQTQVIQSKTNNPLLTEQNQEIEDSSEITVGEAIGLAIGCTLLLIFLIALSGICVYKYFSKRQREEKYAAASENSSQFDAAKDTAVVKA